MASVLDKEVIKDDKKFLYFLIALLIVNIWFFSSLTKHLAEIGIIYNNIRYRYAQLTHQKYPEEYEFHRNNAVYLVRLNNKIRTKHAVLEMDKSIATAPDYLPQYVVQNLYKDRAYIKLFAGDKKGALDDFILSSDILSTEDNIKVAAILTEQGAFGVARKYCQDVLKADDSLIAGYVCMSHVYEQMGKPKSALKIYNYAIDEKYPNNAKLYVERALLKQRINDYDGYEKDIEKAKKISPNVDIKKSLMSDAINLTKLDLQVQ